MNLQFKSVELYNFGSYIDTKIDLSNKGFCLVTGENHCKQDNAQSNGSGKSFIWNAICFALTGETLSGLRSSLKNIYNVEDENAYVKLIFNNDYTSFEITRIISPKSDLKILKNGNDISGKGLRESEKILSDELPELTKDLLASCIILGQGMPNKLSSFSPSGRKELLEKLTKSDFMIEDLKARIVNRQQILTSQLRQEEDNLLVTNTKIDANISMLTAALDKQQNTVKPDFDNLILNFNTQLNYVHAKLAEINTDIDSKNIDLTDKTNKLSKLAEEKATVQQQEYQAYSSKLNELNQQKTKLDTLILNLNAEISKLEAITDICPTCGQHIPNVIKPSTDSQKALLLEYNNELKTTLLSIENCNKRHSEYLNEINVSFSTELATLTNSVAELKTIIASQMATKEKLQEELLTINTQITKVTTERDQWDSTAKDLALQIDTLKLENTSLISNHNTFENNIINYNKHLAAIKKIDTFTKKEFRSILLYNIIEYINCVAKEFAKIIFNSDNINIYLDGNNINIEYCKKPIEALSGGERARVDVIIQLALRAILQKYLNFNSNILVLDEITDYLDKQSCSAVMQFIESSLKNIESVFIISHHADELSLPIDTELKIYKNENGISELIA